MPKTGSLITYAVTRLILSLPMLFILLTVVFFVLRVIPGDPIAALLAEGTPPYIVEAVRHSLGLDRPYWEQYLVYLAQIFTGNLGISIGQYFKGQSVLAVILQRLPATAELTIGAMLVASIIGVGTGLIAGVNRDKPVDLIVRLYGTIIFVIPIFWLGEILQIVFAVNLGLLPAQGRFSGLDPPATVTGFYTIDSLLAGRIDKFFIALQHLVLPCLTLGLVLSGFFTKTVRANLLRTISSDYVEAAKARGIPRGRIITRYALKNALIPVVTVLGLQFAILFAGAVLTERTFSWPGMGSLLLLSINTADYPMIQGTIVVYAFIIVVISVIVDIINGLIDPRVRY
ncbi:peptide ABC transporter permease [archaeon 13_1_40CM_2_52_13]|nr:MAG: peptide ABC transporter permease [archaeon 13_1_40CM_2_52_13]OLE71078.1 MAG: peptide ABC transporter permease [archaeon 13_1_20CM_2_51_12]